ncbi:MAG: MFS transporter [Burkholderiaceae bacterium]|nr:MAG: MFS transporter [Burkholderiaceae bacterium]
MNVSAEPAAPSARATLLTLTVLSALAFMDRQILSVLLVPVKADFGLSDLQAGLVSGVGFAISFGLLALPLGRLGDRRERRSLVAACRGLGGALAALGAAAGSAWSLALTRMGGAVSDAGGAPASMSMIADLYPPHERSQAMGVYAMGASAGALLALLGGAWVAQRWGWRATLAVVGGAGLLAAIAMRAIVREPERGRWAIAASAPMPSQGGVAAVWRQPVARWLIVAAGFILLSAYSFGAWNFAYLMRAMGLGFQQAGWATGLAAVASMLAAPVSGWLADRIARRSPGAQIGVPMAGLALALPLGLAYLALPPSAIVAAVLLMTVYAFFVAWWIAPVYALLSLVVPTQHRGVANAMVMLVGAVGGGGIGPVLTGALADAMARWVDGDPLRPALALMLALIVPSWLALRRARQHHLAQQAHAAATQAS